jgi:predicted kinase
VFAGERVIVDATFWQEQWRATFLEAATRWGVQGVLFSCHADPHIVRDRLAKRKNDVSDADWAVHLEAARRWEEMAPATSRAARLIATDAQPDQALAHALEFLRDRGLAH